VDVHSYNKDAAMTYRHSGAQPVYAPNSRGGPRADARRGADLGWPVAAGELGRYAYESHAEDDDFVQARALYRDVMSDTDRTHLATNIVGHASDDVSDDVQRRVIAYWANVDPQLGAQVATGLGHGDGGGERERSTPE
jgi:catalase